MVEVEAGLRLTSVVYRELWVPRTELAARCRRPLAALPWSRMPLHEPPNADCCCGIYAIRSPHVAAVSLRGETPGRQRPLARVMGMVALWGRVVEAESGWRAQFAYPAALYVPSGTRQRLLAAALWPYRPSPRCIARELEQYGVPVELFSETHPLGSSDPVALPSLARTTLD